MSAMLRRKLGSASRSALVCTGLLLLVGGLWAGISLAHPADDSVAANAPAVSNQLDDALADDTASQQVPLSAWLDTVTRRELDGVVMELMGFYHGRPMVYITHNANAADTISTDEVQPGGSTGLNLDGTGVVLGIWDGGGVRTSHQEFSGRATQMDSPSSTNFHATHVGGTMIAVGVQAAAHGMSPAAQLHCWDWDNDTNEMRSAAATGLRVSNHSYGYVTGWTYDSSYGWIWYGDVTVSTTEDYLFGLYSDYAREYDVTAYSYPYYLMVKSAGNDRNDTGPNPGDTHIYYQPGVGWTYSTATRDPDGPWDCMSSESVAKNTLSVAAVEDITGGYSGTGSVTAAYFSSTGPTDDGRVKPDIAGNGWELYSCVNNSNSSYGTYSGTSMASPNVSGSLGLLIEHYRATHGNDDMRSATLKGLVLHTADEAGSADGPDYEYGWGLMNTVTAAETISTDVAEPLTISEQTLTNGDSLQLFATTDGSSNELRVSICWTDPPGVAQGAVLNPTTPALVNDLDLRVTRVSDSNIRYPWKLNGAAPTAAATTGDNTVDNVEQIVVNNPGVESWQIQVTHKGTLTDGLQDFSLFITGAVTITTSNDSDNDGVSDESDNCPFTYNPDQLDSDGDLVGNACDDCPYDQNKTEPGVCGCGTPDTDSDNDGVPDCNDGCPNDPDKIDPGICGCGTPDTDSDNDGTPDCNDQCPNDPNKTEPGICGCGTPDTDSDNDGTPDCFDGCPNDPNKIDPGICGCGTPDTDSDNDGTPDCNDLCPNDPDKVDPGTCGCGVPDTDSDNDGTPDCIDGCPNDPDKLEPGICGCGTPDVDSDSDGVPDCNDGCPNDPDKVDPGICGCGTPDTDSDSDGTPDCFDECPNDPDKTAPGVCGCGTPDTDSDNDGTPDCIDGCPDDPDKIDPGICGCGNSDVDSDNDGTPDCNDGCPNDPDKLDPGICGCGTSDTDSDNDGTPDCDDGCPNDPDKIDPGICGCGTPDVDSDNDGTPDCNDGCPNDPDKVDPGVCGCGVPDVDSDNDGTPDCNDGCPNDPDKTDPGICGCGVPDVDSDGDGVYDCDDLCADTPAGTPVDADGCPQQTACRGDANCDGAIDFFDIDPFVAALTSESSWIAYLTSNGYGVCDYVGSNDCNNDGAVDFFDIDPFVTLLTSGATCH